jgi:endonuclease YncB( thermonuclease family)
MYGYDTPELYSKIPGEREKALHAKLFLSNLLLDKLVFIVCDDFDKYGRLLGTIYLSKNDFLKNNPSVNTLMVTENLGVPYFGGTK